MPSFRVIVVENGERASQLVLRLERVPTPGDVIAHGNSSRRAIANAIRLAARGVENDVVGRLSERLPQRTREPLTK